MNVLPNLPPTPAGVIPVHWTGISGIRYEFQLDPIGTAYHPKPGVYIFCRQALNGKWDALYVGETESFQRRLWRELTLHHCWERILAARATHICTLHVPGGLAAREVIETDLRRSTKAPLNLQ
jgi:hypothetical protein